MSATALAWVAKIKVGNQTAKQLLQFYASHNFNKPGFEFKTSTLAEQLEVSERAIYIAHKLLIEKGFIKRVPQYGKDGSQLNTITYLEIPDSFVDNFFKRGGGDELRSGGGCTTFTPRGEVRSPLNSNINNKQNKRESARKKREPLPNPFVFNQKAMDLLCETSKRVNMPNYQLIAKFENVMKSNGKKSCDWNAEFENFLINEKDIKPKINKIESKPNQEIRCTVPDYTPDAPIKRASIENVDKHMDAINKLLSRKVISNGRVSTSKEKRQG